MASGNTLLIFGAHDGVPPGSSYATQDRIVGAASPAETVPVLDFDGASAVEYMDFYGVMPQHYSGGGLTITIVWSASSATSNNCVWQLAFRSLEDDAEDIDTTAHSYDYNTVTGAAPSAVGEVSYDNVTFASGADMDSVDAGDAFILRVKRDPTHASDTITTDCELQAIHIKET